MADFLPKDLTKIENYSYVREIARGDYGVVSLVQHKITKEQLALKVLEIPKKLDVVSEVKDHIKLMNGTGKVKWFAASIPKPMKKAMKKVALKEPDEEAKA